MKLLDAVLPRVQRFVPTTERGTAIAVIAFLIGLEVVGRMATNDLHDSLAGAALVLGGMFLAAWHKSKPVGWISRAEKYIRKQTKRLDHLKYDIGIDFRGTPTIPSRTPRTIWLAFLLVGACASTAFAVWFFYPTGWREPTVQVSYVLYLTLVTVLWMMLIASVAAGVYLPVMVFDQKMRSGSGEESPHQPDAIVVLGYFVCAILIASVTPPVYGLGICGLVFVVSLLASRLPTVGDADFLWRAGTRQPIYSLPMRRLISLAVAFAALLASAVILSASGGQLFTPPSFESPMRVTGFLGALSAWLVPGLVLLGIYQLLQFRRHDPTRREPVMVRIDAAMAPSLIVQAGQLIRRWGFRTTALDEHQPDTVGIRLVKPEHSEATEFDPRWPLKVSLHDLEIGQVKDRIARRDEIQLRRRFLKGLSKLVKQASTIVPTSGGGFWIAPHWWFIETLLWEPPAKGRNADDSPASLRPVGPSYEHLFGTRVRQHWHQILRSTGVDLIYLEQGVSHRRLVQVLRSLLELFDIHGGKRLAEERHFQGVPKVRVMIHDYSPGNPFSHENYPEPKFDDVSRFRVLHIFRDRGESEDIADVPFDFSWEPAPLGMA